jgi:endogenous inhibitor of DNA gyrase (YacG/DUF329 family)
MTKSTSKCPICGKPSDPKWRPACSRQCSYVDLGRWLDGSYTVPGEELVPVAGSRPEDED